MQGLTRQVQGLTRQVQGLQGSPPSRHFIGASLAKKKSVRPCKVSTYKPTTYCGNYSLYIEPQLKIIKYKLLNILMQLCNFIVAVIKLLLLVLGSHIYNIKTHNSHFITPTIKTTYKVILYVTFIIPAVGSFIYGAHCAVTESLSLQPYFALLILASLALICHF